VPKTIEGRLDAKGLRIGIVVSRFNSFITKELLDGALDALGRHGADLEQVEIAWAPGSFEIPLVAKKMLAKSKFDALVALGCVLKGDTSHDRYIASEVTKGLALISLETGVPIGFGVLTPDTMEQAIERAGMKAGNKGAEAALSAVEMANLLRNL